MRGAASGSWAGARGSRDRRPAELSGLAAEFPGYEFGTQQTWGGISITAVRHDGAARPGLYVVVTDDLNEMRRALLEHEMSSPAAGR